MKLTLLSLCGLVLLLASDLSAANAATLPPTITPTNPLNEVPGASGLSISPLRNELTISPGKSQVLAITLMNVTGGPVLAKGSILDFQSDNSTGNPKIVTNPNQTSPASIKKFVRSIGNVQLKAGQKATVNVPIQIPSDATPGAYYGLIEYQSVPLDNNGNTTGANNKVALSAGVSSLVFVTIPGNVYEHMQLDSLHIYNDVAGNNEGVFFAHPPKSAGIQISNLGNAFEKPFGQVQLHNMSGKTIYSYEMNGTVTRGIVLPDSSRIFKNAIQNIKSPGYYTLVANISYGSGSAILVGKKVFWYVPIWLWVIVVIVLLAILLAAFMAWKRYKRLSSTSFKKQ